MLSFFKKIILSPLFISIAVFLLLQLPIFNFGFNYPDEGYLLDNALRIFKGEIPYLNFSLSLTPGAFYIQALLFKIFGQYIILDRIFYILSVVAVLILSSSIFKFKNGLKYISLVSLALIYTGMGVFASYNMYALLFLMLALFFFIKLKENTNVFLAFVLGFFCSLLFLTKQTYGAIFYFSFLILIIYSLKRSLILKSIIYYLLGGILLPLSLVIFLYFKGILGGFIYNVFCYAGAVKNDRMPFILTSLLFIPFFIFIVNFIKRFSLKKIIIAAILFLFFIGLYIYISPSRLNYVFTFYKEPTIYYYLVLIMLPLLLITIFFKSKNKQEKLIVAVSIEAFSLFLASAFSGRDYTTVVVSAPLYIPLFIYVLCILNKKIKFNVPRVSIVLLLIYIFPSLISSVTGYAKFYGSGFEKQTYGNLNIKKAAYINLPVGQVNDLEKMLAMVKLAPADSKILCFPYCSFVTFLSDRRDASYFNFFYKFQKPDQLRVIEDLKKDKNLVIVVEKFGPIEKLALYEDKNLHILKKFIQTNYKLFGETQNFYIYRN